MKGLKCTTSNCEFNEGFHCKAGVVNIDKRGNCITRIKRENASIKGWEFNLCFDGYMC